MGNGKSMFYGCCNNLKCKKSVETQGFKEDCQLQQDTCANQINSYQPNPYKSSQLTLKIISSPILQIDSTLEFNCFGLIGGSREMNDGMAYFGVKRKSKKISDNQKVYYLKTGCHYK